MATLAANKNTSKKKSIMDHHQCLFLGRNFPKKILLCFGGNSYKGFPLGMHQSGQWPHFEERNSEVTIFRQYILGGCQNIEGLLKCSTDLSHL
jgi:hypothetical protein